jgi:hypothetical protein
MRGAKAARAAGALLAVLLVIAWLGAGRAIATPGGEFSNPSPNTLPAASVYNTTPSCPVTRSNPSCDIPAPSSSLPPADADSPEVYLNSAYWPAEKRPDIEMYGIQQYGYNYQNCSAPSTWNHYCFLVDAKAVGYPVSQTPQVGDLFLARCQSFMFVNPAWTTSCPLGNIYYVGYVEQVFSDGSFIVTEGGDGPNDSGLVFEWLSGSMDPNSDFIGLFPPGQSPHLPPVQVSVYINTSSSDTGSGSIRDSNGQTCTSGAGESACSFTEPQGVPVTFTATPQAGSASEGWEGACSGSGSCTVTFNAPWTWLGTEFVTSGSDSGNAGSSGGDTGGTAGKPTVKLPRIVRVRTSWATIHATLAGSHLVCKLSSWNRQRWQRPRVARCGTSVTYRNLTAGRYRLTVVSGRTSATKVVILRHGVSRRGKSAHRVLLPAS